MPEEVEGIDLGRFGNKMRGHHLAVLDIYSRGSVADGEFIRATENEDYGEGHYTGRIKPKMDYLLENQDAEIVLTDGYGMFCDGCKKQQDGRCAKQKGIDGFDRKYIQRIGKEVGDTVTISELMPLIEGIGTDYEQVVKEASK